MFNNFTNAAVVGNFTRAFGSASRYAKPGFQNQELVNSQATVGYQVGPDRTSFERSRKLPDFEVGASPVLQQRLEVTDEMAKSIYKVASVL